MSTLNLAAMLMENVKTVDVRFKKNNGHYTYKTVEDLEEGQVVVVDTQYGPKTARVMEVHNIPKFNSDMELKWVISKVDFTKFEKLNSIEQKFQDQLLRIEQQSKRQQALDALKERLGIEETDKLTQAVKNMNKESKCLEFRDPVKQTTKPESEE